MCQDSFRGCQYEDADVSRGKVSSAPFFEFAYCGGESGSYAAAVVDTSQELNLEFSTSTVVHELELSHVAIFLHDTENLAHQFGCGIDDTLVLVSPLVIEDG